MHLISAKSLNFFVFVRKPSGFLFFLWSILKSSVQLWSIFFQLTILKVKPQQLVENFEQNYGSFLEGDSFSRAGGTVWKVVCFFFDMTFLETEGQHRSHVFVEYQRAVVFEWWSAPSSPSNGLP